MTLAEKVKQAQSKYAPLYEEWKAKYGSQFDRNQYKSNDDYLTAMTNAYTSWLKETGNDTPLSVYEDAGTTVAADDSEEETEILTKKDLLKAAGNAVSGVGNAIKSKKTTEEDLHPLASAKTEAATYDGGDFEEWYKAITGSAYNGEKLTVKPAGISDIDWQVGLNLYNKYMDDKTAQANLARDQATLQSAYEQNEADLAKSRLQAKEAASITYDKLLKYLPEINKANGLDGLGVADSTYLSAANQYANAVANANADADSKLASLRNANAENQLSLQQAYDKAKISREELGSETKKLLDSWYQSQTDAETATANENAAIASSVLEDIDTLLLGGEEEEAVNYYLANEGFFTDAQKTYLRTKLGIDEGTTVEQDTTLDSAYGGNDDNKTETVKGAEVAKKATGSDAEAKGDVYFTTPADSMVEGTMYSTGKEAETNDEFDAFLRDSGFNSMAESQKNGYTVAVYYNKNGNNTEYKTNYIYGTDGNSVEGQTANSNGKVGGLLGAIASGIGASGAGIPGIVLGSVLGWINGKHVQANLDVSKWEKSYITYLNGKWYVTEKAK